MREASEGAWAVPEHLRGLVPDPRSARADLARWCCERCGVHALVDPAMSAPGLCTNCGKYALEPLQVSGGR
jgi:hypothetical protein